MTKNLLIGTIILIVITALLILRPVPIVTEQEAISESRTVAHIFDGGNSDIVFRFHNDARIFYINRGLDEGLEIDLLKEKLLGNEVIIKYPKYWTPLDWNNQIRHLSKIEFRNETIFNELRI